MSVIGERALLRRQALRREIQSRFPVLFRGKAPSVHRHAVALGRDGNGNAVLVPRAAMLEHSHLLGTTGSGKSTCLEHISRQVIADGCGMMIVDPHGEHPGSLYRSLLAWLSRGGYLDRRRVHLIDPNSDSHTVAFNPLLPPDAETDLSVVAGVTLEAFSRAWGGENMANKPTIERVLTTTFTALADLHLSLVEAPLLLDRRDRHGLRATAIAKVRDRFTRDELQRLDDLARDERRRADFDLEVLGPLNRLARFLRPPTVRAMLGQTERTLDLRAAMDDGHVILANLSGGARVYETDADLLGRLLTRAVFFHAKRRKHTERPFFLVLDECHRYLSGDVEGLLAEARKYGICVLLANQWLAQLHAAGETTLAAVQNATNVKCVFRLKDAQEAETVAASVVPLDLQRPVDILTKPAVVGHRRITLANRSDGEQFATTQGRSFTDTTSESHTVSKSETVSETTTVGHGESWSDSDSQSAGVSTTQSDGESRGRSRSDSYTPSLDFFRRDRYESYSDATDRSRSQSSSSGSSRQSGTSHSDGGSTSFSHAQSVSQTDGESFTTGRSHAKTQSESDTRGASQSRGESEALEPVFERLPSSVYSKDAMLYLAAQRLGALRTGEAFISFVSGTAAIASLIRIPAIATARLSEPEFRNLRERVFAASPAALPIAAAAQAIAARKAALLEALESAEPHEPENFRVKAPSITPGRGRTPPVAVKRQRSPRSASLKSDT